MEVGGRHRRVGLADGTVAAAGVRAVLRGGRRARRLGTLLVVLRLLLPHRLPADRVSHHLHLADGPARRPARL